MASTEQPSERTAPRHQLSAFFAPRSVAIIGATENPGSVGLTILWNLMSNPFGGTVYPVNPKRSSVLGIKAYASVKAVAEPVDLAVRLALFASVLPWARPAAPRETKIKTRPCQASNRRIVIACSFRNLHLLLRADGQCFIRYKSLLEEGSSHGCWAVLLGKDSHACQRSPAPEVFLAP